MPYAPLRFAALALLPLALGACSAVSDAVVGPQLSAIDYPTRMAQAQQGAQFAAGRPGSANSLWRTGSHTFFRDQRASKVGDILTVEINIKDNATLSNESDTARKTSADGGFTHMFGLESLLPKVLPGSPDPAHLVTNGSTTSSTGTGSVNRSEAVSLTIAATVTGVMPNGNLTIQGKQEVRINNELRELTIAGFVRPEDISADNTIQHTQIAEARVSYGGRGAVSRVQKVPVGQALGQEFTPF